MSTPTTDELARQVARLEKRMSTLHAEWESAVEQIEARIVGSETQKSEFEEWMAQSNKRIIFATLSAVGFSALILGILVSRT